MSEENIPKSQADFLKKIALYKVGTSLVSDAYFQLEDTIKKLKSSEEKTKESDRIKDLFLSFATHGLKSPLTPIKTQTQLLLSGYYGELNKKQKDAIEMIYRNGEALNALSNDVFDVAKINSNELKMSLESTDLCKIVADAVCDIKILADKKNITFLLLPLPEISKMRIDGTRISQALYNLLDNAIKFTPENGTINVEVIEKKDEVVVRVKDSGIGISGDDIEKLFVPFFQVKNACTDKRVGTGLGLAVCKGIIEAHDGKIWAESGGEGSVFVFSLPIKN